MEESYLKRQRIYKTIMLVILTIFLTIIITTMYMANKYDLTENNITSLLNSSEKRNNISKTINNIKSILDDYYLNEIDEVKTTEGAIKGYVDGLGDPYTKYITKDEMEEYTVSLTGNYVGIGVYMTQDLQGNTVVIEPIEESPAEAAGILSNDIIVEVNGEDVTGEDTATVSAKIKGEEGTMVKLKLIRDNEFVEVEVERKAIKVYHVKNEMLENNVGYIKLSTFDEGCSEEFKTAFETVKGQGAKKLIIDLRDNTGGLVDEALNILDMIVEKDKTMLITVDANGNKEVTTAKQDPIINMEIVVLVNEYSASASEILVGALKDHQKAQVVGVNTYGKGVIQNVFSLADGSVLKLTTAEYFTPNETQIHKKGIVPDVEVQLVEEEKDQEEVDEQLEKALEIINK